MLANPYGFANMEGLMRINLFDSWKKDMNQKFSDFLPADLRFESEDQKESVSNQIKQFYFGDKPVDEENIISYVDFFSDVIFAYPSLRIVKYHVEAGHDEIYLYEYSYVDENTPFVPHTKIKGADHGAQIVAVFNGIPEIADASNFTEEFVKFSAMVRKLWGNFIRTGYVITSNFLQHDHFRFIFKSWIFLFIVRAPVIEGSPLDAWPAVGAGWSPHLSIGTEFHLRGPLLERRMRFWDELYTQYYRDPVPPVPPSTTRHNEL